MKQVKFNGSFFNTGYLSIIKTIFPFLNKYKGLHSRFIKSHSHSLVGQVGNLEIT